MGVSERQEEVFFSDLLKKFRRRKKLTQKQLAERIEVSRDSVSFWERGAYKPEADRILYKLVDVLGLTAQEQQQLFEAYTVTALATSFHNPPFKRNPYFTGRTSQLNTLHILLMAGKQVALTQAISGLGGIGKTQLALEYAHRHQKSYHDIFWVTADTYDALMTSYVRLAIMLHLPEANEQDQSKIQAGVQQWLSKHTGWLLIVDNLENLSFIDQFIPVNRQGAVLLTTRQHVTEPVAQALELELLPENDAMFFLLKRTKVLTVDMSLKDASDHDTEMVRTITHLLGHLPLALDQAGAYILETSCSFAEYLALFQTYENRLLQRRIGERIPTDHPESVTTTFQLNFQQVQQRSHAAADLLCLCACLAPDAIPEEILTMGASFLGPVLSLVAGDGLLLNQAIEALRAYSLVRRDPTGKTLSIHRLVQAVLQDTLEENEQRTWAERAMCAVNAAFPNVEHATWPQCERLLSHALIAAQLIKEYQISSSESGRLLYLTGEYLRNRARYKEAEPLYQHALHIREQQLGPEHPDVARLLHGFAELYRLQGKYTEAEPLYRRSLHIWEQSLGPEHSDVAYTLNGLANLHAEQGKYEQAEPLYLHAARIREQTLGSEHPDVALPLGNLANVYVEQGKYEQAEALYQRALNIQEQAQGSEHLGVTYTLTNLASLYARQGKYGQAEALFQKAVQIREQKQGLDHPDVAYILNNLATLYTEQGKYEQAEPLFQRAVHICEQALSSNHPQFALTLNGLAELYTAQGRYEQAESLFKRALHVYEQALGTEHPQTTITLRGLATLYRDQGKYEQAKPLYQRTLSIRERRFGSKHPATAESLHDIAALQEAHKNKDEAASLYQQALASREQALGAQHPRTRETRTRLIALLHELGQYEQVAQFEIVQSEQETIGEEGKTHPAEE